MPADVTGRHSNDAICLSRQFSHPFSLGYALICAYTLHWLRREPAAVQTFSEETLALAIAYGVPNYMAIAMTWHGWVAVEHAQLEEGFAELRQGIAKWREGGSDLLIPCFLGLLADACIKTGRLEEGLDVLAEVRAVIDRTGERLWEAEAPRLEGLIWPSEVHTRAASG